MSVSVTTRPMRPGEADGVDYHFIDHATFERMVVEKQLLEHARVFGNYYGTPRAPVELALSKGREILFDIDWQGTQQLAENAREDLVSIFVLPPSSKELERRLHARAQDSAEVIASRMAKAADEMSHYFDYEYVIVNYDRRKQRPSGPDDPGSRAPEAPPPDRPVGLRPAASGRRLKCFRAVVGPRPNLRASACRLGRGPQLQRGITAASLPGRPPSPRQCREPRHRNLLRPLGRDQPRLIDQRLGVAERLQAGAQHLAALAEGRRRHRFHRGELRRLRRRTRDELHDRRIRSSAAA